MNGESSGSSQNKAKKHRYKKEKMSHEKKIAIGILFGVLFVTVVFWGTSVLGGMQMSSTQDPGSSSPSSSAATENTTSETEETTAEEETTEETTEADAEKTEDETSSETDTEADDAGSENSTDFSTQVPESAAVDDDYFSDAIFMGDSRTEGFALFSGLSTMTTYASRGLNVSTVFTDATIDLNGTKVTAIDALRSSSFSKLYIMFGLNEASWPYSEVFIEEYGDIIDEAKAINPDAIIYIQSILPVTKSFSDSSELFNKPKIDSLNQMLRQLAADKQVYFVNCEEAVENSEGYLPEDSATDGIHFGVPECEAWLEYLKTHTVSN